MGLLNMTISILDDAYHKVKEALLDKKNDYEVLNYFISSVKAFIGMETDNDNILSRKMDGEGLKRRRNDEFFKLNDKSYEKCKSSENIASKKSSGFHRSSGPSKLIVKRHMHSRA